MKLFKKFKLFIFWKKVRSIIFLISILLPSIYIFIKLNKGVRLLTEELINNPLFTALVGAIIGGLLAFYVSIYIFNAERKAHAALSRRDVIFIPLYNDLLLFKESLSKDPCPGRIVINPEEKPFFSPKFSIWTSFKSDYRHLSVPKQLAFVLDQFMESIQKFSEMKKLACEDESVKETIKNILSSKFDGQFITRLDLVYHYLPCSSENKWLFEKLKDDVEIDSKSSNALMYSDEFIQDAVLMLYNQCGNDNNVSLLYSYRNDLEVNLDELIKTIEGEIVEINKSFEKYKGWI